MYLTQKTFNKPSLPPLSSLLKDQNYKLPSIETFYHNSNASMSNDSVVSPTSRVSTPATPLTASATPISMQHPINHPILPLSNAPTVPSTNQPEIDTATEKKTPEKKRKTDKSFAFISHSVQTFPSQEPSIDNAPLARRKRRRTSPNELNILNQEFILGSTPNKLRRIEIANKVSMTEKAVQIWFQNKRQSIRKQSSNQSEITELPPTNDSSLVNSPINSSINSSMINSMNNSVNNSMVNNTANSSMISSTPIKPILSKSQSFSSPDNLLKTLSPIKPRSSSTSIIFSKPFVPPSAPQQTPSAISSSTPNVTVNQSTPNTSTIEDDSLVLNETKKKQPLSLNNLNSSTMTFKLSKFKPNNDNKENFPLKKSTKKNNKIQNLLNNVVNDENERKPLLELNNNKKVNEGVQNLLSLREGHWR